MKKMYKVVTAVLIFLTLSFLLLAYINQTLIPIKLKDILIKYISRQIQRDVEVSSLKFSLTRGFVLNGIKIYDGPKEKELLFFKADECSFSVIFIPTFKNYIFITPRLHFNKPYLKIERAEDGRWNTPWSLLVKEGYTKKKLRLRVIVESISFCSGELYYTDNYKKSSFKKSVTGLKGTAVFALPNYVSLKSSGKITDSPIRLNARFKPDKKELLAEIETENFAFADYANIYLAELLAERTATAPRDQSQLPLPQADAVWPALSSLSILKINSGLCSLSLRIDVSNLDVKTKGDINIKDLDATFKDIKAAGNYKLSGGINFVVNKPESTHYDARLELNDADILTSFKSIGKADMINGVVHLTDKDWAIKQLSANLYGTPCLISGKVLSPHKEFVIDTEVVTSMPLKNIPYAKDMGVENGKADIKTRLIYKKDRSYRITARTTIVNLKLRQKDITIGGNFLIDGESCGIAGNVESLTYKGTINFEKAAIEGAGLLPFISGASGDATFSTKHLNIKKLTGSCADTKIILSGDINYEPSEPTFSLKLKTEEFSLSKFLSTLPEEIMSRFKDISAEGICSIDADLKGILGNPQTFIYDGNLSLQKGMFKFPYWPYEISDTNCSVQFKKHQILWQDLYFNFKGTRYQSYGRLSNFAAPEVSLNLKAKEMEVIAELKSMDKKIDILKCDARYYGSYFLAAGNIQDIKNPILDIRGKIEFDLKDTLNIFTAHTKVLQKLKPEGIINLNFSLQGPLKEPDGWILFLEGGAKSIYIWGLRLDDFYLDYRMKDYFIDIPVIMAYPYGGIINISSRANLKPQERPYMINIDVKDVDLRQLIQDTEFKNKKISGTFASQVVLNGFLGQKDSLKGKGWLQVSNGYLWEFPVMRGILELILMIPPEYVTLTDAFGNFSIKSNGIYTEDFKMLSKTASLLWVGLFGFDGSMDFSITGRFAENVIKQTTEPGKIAGAILREAGSLIMEIRLTGTLAKPKYQLVPFPISKIFKEKIVDKVRDIFGNIF